MAYHQFFSLRWTIRHNGISVIDDVSLSDVEAYMEVGNDFLEGILFKNKRDRKILNVDPHVINYFK